MGNLRPPRGKKSTAESKNIVLEKGSVFFETPEDGTGTGYGNMKMGDGETAYKDLPYFMKDNTKALEELDTKVTNIKNGTSAVTKATSATYATTATNAGTATYATNSGTATYSTNGAKATSATYATTATNAGTATYATNAGTATYSTNGAKASSATSATYATTATKAGAANTAGTATYATNAGTAAYAKTATAGSNNTEIANTAFVQAAISSLVDSAPETLNTLNELSAALGDDPNFAVTIANHIGTVDGKITNIMNGTSAVSKATTATKAGTATYATNSGTATYSTNGAKATSATSATYATTATKAGTATYSTNSAKASSATSATYAATATKAGTATYATNSGTATYSTNGAKASSATSATYAATATKAGTATYATNAGRASTANYSTNANASDFLHLYREQRDLNIMPSVNHAQLIECTMGSTHTPSDAFYHVLSCQSQDTAYGTQLALGMTDQNLYMRWKRSGSFSDWSRYVKSSELASASVASATKLTTPRTINGTTFDGSSDITLQSGRSWWVGTENANSSGWYKFMTKTMVLHEDFNMILSVTDEFSLAGDETGNGTGTGMLYIHARCNISTKTDNPDGLHWLVRSGTGGLSSDCVMVVIDGLTIDFYIYQGEMRWGRYHFCVISESGRGDKTSYTAVSSSSPTTGLTAAVYSSDLGVVNTAIHVENGRLSGSSAGTNTFTYGSSVTASGLYSHAIGVLTVANNTGSYAEGYGTTSSASYAHAEGYQTNSASTATHAEGYQTVASAAYAHAEGYKTTASKSTSHSEGYCTLASGNYSHAEGYFTLASGNYSHAECYGTTASGGNSHAEGNNTNASGYYAHAEGYKTTASALAAHAEGDSTVADYVGHAEGYKTTAGKYAHAGGHYTIALDNQCVIGHYNTTKTAASNSGTTGSLFIIGNGTGDTSSNAFRVTGTGEVYGQSSYYSQGADYAEFAEWADKNVNEEDRRGYFVTYDEEKTECIRIANEGDYILGIVSANPCIVGNSDESWLGKFLYDDFGSPILEEVEIEVPFEVEVEKEIEVEYIDEETGETKTRIDTVIDHETQYKKETTTRYKVNPEYDDTREYISRSDRPEWDYIGWMGVLAVRDDGTCVPGGYCKHTDGGIATAAERGDNTYRVLTRVTDNIIKVSLK